MSYGLAFVLSLLEALQIIAEQAGEEITAAAIERIKDQIGHKEKPTGKHSKH